MSQQKDKIILGIAGELLSGKTTAAEFYIKNYSAKHYKFSGLIDQVLSTLHLPLTRKNEQDMGAMMKELYGDGVWAHALATNALLSDHAFVLFDGLRKIEEIKVLKQELPSFRLVYIDAPLELRFERSKNRTEKPDDGQRSFEEFKASQLHAADIDIASLRDHADHLISNTGSLDEFHAQLAAAMQGFIS
jgi:dephospho-CoA kinase